MAKAKTDGDRAIAERVAKGKDPEKALKRAFPDRDPGEVLWSWFAQGLVPIRGAIGTLAGQAAHKAPIDTLVQAAMQLLPRHPLRSAAMAWSVHESYEAHPAEWEARLDTLPHELRLLLIWPQRRAKKDVPAALREEAVEIYVRALIDDQHDHLSDLSDMAAIAGVDERAFYQRVNAQLEATPTEEIHARGRLAGPLALAPWPLARRVLGAWVNSWQLLELLEKRGDPASDLVPFLRERGLDTDPSYAPLLARRLEAQGEPSSEALDDALVQRLAEGNGDAATLALIARFPPERFEAFAAALKATGTRAYSCLGLLRDPALDAEAIEAVWRIIEVGVGADDYRHVLADLSTPLREIAAAGAHGHGLLERLLERARTLDATFGDKLSFAVYPPNVRFQLKRAMLLASAGQSPAPLHLLLPGEDLLWVDRLVSVLGPFGGGSWEIMADLSEEERAQILAAWARLDWDGTLDTHVAASQALVPPPIEERSWAELAADLRQTGYPRLSTGEAERQTVSRALARAPGDAERLALVDELLAREVRLSGVVLRGLLTLVKVVLPLWIAEAQPLSGARKTVAEALLGAGAKGDLRKSLVQLTSAKKRR